MRIAVLADTHVPDFASALPPALLVRLRRADLIVHAGDVTRAALLDDLQQLAPVRVALGNNDGADVRAWGAREEVVFDAAGVRVAVVHDAGPKQGRPRRLRRRFPDASLIVFGHSHIPVDEEHEGVRLLNPGSPTWKRRQPVPTFAEVTIGRGRVRPRILALA